MNSIFACKNMFSLCATEDGQGKVSTRFSYSICNSNFSIYKPGLACSQTDKHGCDPYLIFDSWVCTLLQVHVTGVV